MNEPIKLSIAATSKRVDIANVVSLSFFNNVQLPRQSQLDVAMGWRDSELGGKGLVPDEVESLRAWWAAVPDKFFVACKGTGAVAGFGCLAEPGDVSPRMIDGDPLAIMPILWDAIPRLDKDVRFGGRRLRDMAQQWVRPTLLVAQAVGAIGLSALLLVLFGLYGVMTYVVSQRRQEIGIRMAIGAGRGTILRMMLREGLQLVSVGIYPERMKILVAKGTIAPRAAYEPVAAEIVTVDTPGATAVNPARFTFRRVRDPNLFGLR